MFAFIFSLIVILIGVALVAKGRVTLDGATLRIRSMGVVVLLVGVGLLAWNSVAVVPAKNIGVTVAFAKPTGKLSNGWHLIAPWESVALYDATIQTPELDKLPVFDVRIANNMTAKMRVSIDWQLADEADITKIHTDWKAFENIESRIVNTRAFDALNKVFNTYDPLAALQAQTDPNVVPVVTKSFNQLEADVRTELQATLPAGVVVRRLQIPFAEWPPVVQEALNKFRAELANTQIALQQEATAAAQKAAIDKLNEANLTPDAFQYQCLIVTERILREGKALPPMWSCTASQSAIGNIPIG